MIFGEQPQQQPPTIEREISYPSFGWAVQRSPDGVARLVLIAGTTAHIFPMSGIDFARFKRDCENAIPTAELNGH